MFNRGLLSFFGAWLQKVFCSFLHAHPPQAPRQTYLSFVRIGSIGTCLRHLSWFRPTSFGVLLRSAYLRSPILFLGVIFPSVLSYPPGSSSVRLDTHGGPPENPSEKHSSLAWLKASCTWPSFQSSLSCSGVISPSLLLHLEYCAFGKRNQLSTIWLHFRQPSQSIRSNQR